MYPDPLKDLSQLRNLFPDMDEYTPSPGEEKVDEVNIDLTSKEKSEIKLYVSRDKKQRAGKQVTLVEGHPGPEEVLQKLLSTLKSICATGGSLKEGVILIQGDHVKKVISYLIQSGYRQTKQKGG